jgi:hypothetical protein
MAVQQDETTSLYYPFFQNMFEMVDATSYAWQPVLKAIGRTQLEFASLQARQTRAWVRWTHQMTQPASPADFLNANAELWASLTQDYLDVAPRVAAAVETVAEAVAPKVIQMAPSQRRDTLILLDRDDEPAQQRMVA